MKHRQRPLTDLHLWTKNTPIDYKWPENHIVLEWFAICKHAFFGVRGIISVTVIMVTINLQCYYDENF